MEKISKQKLKAAMLAAGIGAKTLAESAGLSQCLISKFLKDDYSTVRLPTLSRLSKVLGVPANDLILED